MAVAGKCCFILPVETSVALIGLISMAVSFTGLILSISSLMLYFPLPDDPLLQSLLEVCFFRGVHGVAFYSIFFLLSTIMFYGTMSNVPPLLVPWLGWSPFLVAGILAQLIMAIIRQPKLALPLTSFCFMLLLFIVYGTLVVAVHYRNSMARNVQIRIFNLRSGELPRIVQVPWTMAERIGRGVQNQGMPPPTSSSARPLQGERTDMGRRLRSAYTRFVTAARLSKEPSTDIPRRY